jgi:hypothetical protein
VLSGELLFVMYCKGDQLESWLKTWENVGDGLEDGRKGRLNKESELEVIGSC